MTSLASCASCLVIQPCCRMRENSRARLGRSSKPRLKAVVLPATCLQWALAGLLQAWVHTQCRRAPQLLDLLVEAKNTLASVVKILLVSATTRKTSSMRLTIPIQKVRVLPQPTHSPWATQRSLQPRPQPTLTSQRRRSRRKRRLKIRTIQKMTMMTTTLTIATQMMTQTTLMPAKRRLRETSVRRDLARLQLLSAKSLEPHSKQLLRHSQLLPLLLLPSSHLSSSSHP